MPMLMTEGPLIRSIEDFRGQPLLPDVLRPVSTAKVLFVNHEAIQHDFPELSDSALSNQEQYMAQAGGLGRMPDAAACRRLREAWLLRHAALMSETQIESGRKVNTSVPARETRICAWRPPRYGRAALVCAHDLSGRQIGLLDLKGIGVSTGNVPSLGNMSNGLMNVHESITEVLVEQLVGHIFAASGLPERAVPHYGVIDLGFKVLVQTTNEDFLPALRNLDANLLPDLSPQRVRRFLTKAGRYVPIPAVVLARRAHIRPEVFWGSADPGETVARRLLDLECVLRRRGLASATRLLFDVRQRGTKLWYTYGGGRYIPSPSERQRIRGLIRLNGRRRVVQHLNIQFTAEMIEGGRGGQIFDFGTYQPVAVNHTPLFYSRTSEFHRLDGVIRFPGEDGYVPVEPEASVPAATALLPMALTVAYKLGALDGSAIQQAIKERIESIVARFTDGA